MFIMCSAETHPLSPLTPLALWSPPLPKWWSTFYLHVTCVTSRFCRRQSEHMYQCGFHFFFFHVCMFMCMEVHACAHVYRGQRTSPGSHSGMLSALCFRQALIGLPSELGWLLSKPQDFPVSVSPVLGSWAHSVCLFPIKCHLFCVLTHMQWCSHGGQRTFGSQFSPTRCCWGGKLRGRCLHLLNFLASPRDIKKIDLFLLYVYRRFAYMYICVLCACRVPIGSRRQCHSP